MSKKNPNDGLCLDCYFKDIINRRDIVKLSSIVLCVGVVAAGTIFLIKRFSKR